MNPTRLQTQRIGNEKDLLQPFKKGPMGTQINEDFVEVYGSEKLREFDPEAADYYKKKGK